MSTPEVMLWSRLKRLRAEGYHFRRQAPFRGYFLDFVCYARRLAVEVDGGQHSEDQQADHDVVRDSVLARHGFRLLRFWAGEVRGDLTLVMDQVIRALKEQPSTRPSGDSQEHRTPALTSPP